MTRETVKFEGIDFTADGTGGPIPDYYAGFHWQAIFAIDTRNLPEDSGYKIGTHSGRSAAYNDPGLGIDQKFSSDISFTLKSVYLAALSAPLDVTFTAFSGATEVGHKTFHLDGGDDQFTFGHKFRHITSVTIDTGDNRVVMDDMKVVFDGDIPGTAAPTHDAHADLDAASFATHVLPHAADVWF